MEREVGRLTLAAIDCPVCGTVVGRNVDVGDATRALSDHIADTHVHFTDGPCCEAPSLYGVYDGPVVPGEALPALKLVCRRCEAEGELR